MQFAEVFLRLGLALVAWMVLYAHFLWLAALYAMGCGPDGDEMHRLLLGLAPFTIGLSFALRATRPFDEIHSMLRWLGVPLILLTPFAVRSAWQVLRSVYVAGESICGGATPAAWQNVWAPAQFVTLTLALYMIFRVWRSVRIDGRGTENT
jgi:hypothetical protein